jgi:hypothetical protein
MSAALVKCVSKSAVLSRYLHKLAREITFAPSDRGRILGGLTTDLESHN